MRLKFKDYIVQGFRFFSRLVGQSDPWSKKMAGHFLKWWAQAYLTNHSWHFVIYFTYSILTADDSIKPFFRDHWKQKTNFSWMQAKSIAECSKGSILQYFWSSLSYHLLLRSLFFVFFEWLLKICFTVLTTYMYFLFCGGIFLKWDFFTTKKDGSTGPTALKSYGPYFEIMGQWPGPTVNLKAWLLFFQPKHNVNGLSENLKHTVWIKKLICNSFKIKSLSFWAYVSLYNAELRQWEKCISRLVDLARTLA